MIFKILPPEWLKHKLRPREGEYAEKDIAEFNKQGYGIFWHPNCPSQYDPNRPVNGSDIDLFSYVFVDMDEKDGVWTKGDFIEAVLESRNPEPTFLVDSGNGIHAYWAVSDLDPMSYLRFQRRLCRYFKTDEAVSKLCQVMRYPGTVNTKHEDAQSLAEMLHSSEFAYSSEQLDAVLPPITMADEAYCKEHYDKTHNLVNKNVKVDDKLPLKFCQLLRNNSEVKEIWAGGTDDRSKADYRLGHILFASGFTREEARSVLVNSAKALTRSPTHRIGYADGIIDKIWTYELAEDKDVLDLSSSVRDILNRHGQNLKGTRFRCWRYLDDTVHGFTLGQTLGLVAGVGVGKTAIALNMFEGFVTSNPDYVHFFVALEQPENEIAARWRRICGDNAALHDKVHIISNYAPDGSYRNLSLDDIRKYILKFQSVSGHKAGCVVVDHIGVLKKSSKEGRQSIEDICHQMKAFAVQTQTFLVMQSQAPREKAGQGDLELDKDAAYGTVFFESYADYLVTLWQPLKRAYDKEGCPKVTAFKFCKIREKDPEGKDVIKEDIRYRLAFGADSRLREMTQDQEIQFDYFNSLCANIRKQDKKTEVVPYVSARWEEPNKCQEHAS